MRFRKKPWIAEAILEYRDEYVYLGDSEKNKGQWRSIFGGKPISLEIGCGKGAFITGMAELYPQRAFIGVETQTDIAYYAAKLAKEKGLTNVKIICGNAAYLEEWFELGEISAMYLNFSDPWPKARTAKRRLTYRGFLAKYHNILGSGAHLRFKTDNDLLFAFSLEEFEAYGVDIVACTNDLHHSQEYENPVQTEYERRFSALGKKINFCEVVFK